MLKKSQAKEHYGLGISLSLIAWTRKYIQIMANTTSHIFLIMLKTIILGKIFSRIHIARLITKTIPWYKTTCPLYIFCFTNAIIEGINPIIILSITPNAFHPIKRDISILRI